MSACFVGGKSAYRILWLSVRQMTVKLIYFKNWFKLNEFVKNDINFRDFRKKELDLPQQNRIFLCRFERRMRIFGYFGTLGTSSCSSKKNKFNPWRQAQEFKIFSNSRIKLSANVQIISIECEYFRKYFQTRNNLNHNFQIWRHLVQA